ncbi:MAG: ComEC/Rec2 family competence protein [Dongiaceae bacterium]
MTSKFFAFFLNQRERWFFWTPVFWALGIAGYFSLPAEPSVFPVVAITGGLAAMFFWASRRQSIILFPALIVLLMALGFIAASFRTDYLATPLLTEQIGPVRIQGTVLRAQSEATESGGRLTLGDIHFTEREDPPILKTVRIRVRQDLKDFIAGDRIEALVILRPPPAPVLPGSFDFQRYAYFEKISAMGFALGEVHKLAETAPSSWRLKMELLRERIIQRVYSTVKDGDSAALTAALITNEQAGLSDKAAQAMRDSGLQHILSVSGFHLSLVGGFVFIVVRYFLLLFPVLALRHDIKKWAAAAALVVTFLYLILAGMEVPTQRAFIMIAFIFMAVLLDRVAFSLRPVAWAALFILILQPDALLSASFQLSFAAVIALIAAFEAWQKRGGEKARGVMSYLSRYVMALAFSTIIATAATSPIVAYHFHRFSVYGLLSNFLAAPLSGVWIMPLMLVSLLLMPFGLDYWPLVAMGWGSKLTLDIAYWVASLEGAVINVPAYHAFSFACFIAGLLWLCLWQGKLRLSGLVFVIIGALALPFTHLPDILLSHNGRLWGIRDEGRLMVSSLRREKFIAEQWSRYYGQENILSWDDKAACDSTGCIWIKDTAKILFAKRMQAAFEDCGKVDFIIAPMSLYNICPQTPIIDARFLRQSGPVALFIDKDKIEIITDRSLRGTRPWVVAPQTYRKYKPKTEEPAAETEISD